MGGNPRSVCVLLSLDRVRPETGIRKVNNRSGITRVHEGAGLMSFGEVLVYPKFRLLPRWRLLDNQFSADDGGCPRSFSSLSASARCPTVGWYSSKPETPAHPSRARWAVAAAAVREIAPESPVSAHS